MLDLQAILDVLEESRDDVLEARNSLEHGKAYPSYARRIALVDAQLARHDAVLAQVRAAIAQQGTPNA